MRNTGLGGTRSLPGWTNEINLRNKINKRSIIAIKKNDSNDLQKRHPAGIGGWLSVACVAVLLTQAAGCRTFNMTQEEFDAERRGEWVDSEVGDAVAWGGSIGALAGMIGAAIHEGIK